MANGVEDFYCDEVLSGNTPVEKVFETEHSLAFYHTRPFYEVHIVVIPKKHISSLIDINSEDQMLFQDLLSVIQMAAKHVNEQYGACTVATNLGDYQSNKHLHWHVHYGKRTKFLDGPWC
ncbi:HIT domain-containing protein [Cytobacillus spongiae]|jgi:histidine triad (HIT) family protein|uniref:HIT family protein n=1 Tax=Cytobacillus spongiae TaxID=2901381 RepID=UPI001F396E5F|nr:HIT domain-containing protein [Cytobacillus spongiae]UII57586.1 HIT domain-containing protein [Cytobacillus spongiae]